MFNFIRKHFIDRFFWKDVPGFVGRRFHSRFFGKDFIVTRYKSDSNWYFHFVNGTEEFSANTKLSHFIDNGFEIHSPPTRKL